MSDNIAENGSGYSDILYSVDDSVATLVITRRKRLNAFNGHTIH